MGGLQTYLNRLWYHPSCAQRLFSILLLPLAWLLQLFAQHQKNKHSARAEILSVSVIVVGNIAIGGTGKTPVIIALSKALLAAGFSPGVVSRGYGGVSDEYPLLLKNDTPVAESGDEPALIFQASGVPVCVAPLRTDAVKRLIEEGCDVILSDDGLQHYKMARDFELVVIDASRKLGNNRTLPAGPLREPRSRLQRVDCIVSNGENLESLHKKQFQMKLLPSQWVALSTNKSVALADFDCAAPAFAISGIGNPQRFFTTLGSLNIESENHSFPDHHDFCLDDLEPFSGKRLLMTAKDAVKCANFCSQLDCQQWYFLEVEAEFDSEFYEFISDAVTRIATEKSTLKNFVSTK